LANAKSAGRARSQPRRRWPGIVLVLAVLAASLAFANRAEIGGLAITGTAYGAHVGCSCRHIGGRSLGDCEKDFEPGMELVWLSEDEEEKSVTASIPLVASQTATYREGEGCVLEPWKS
jgi:hypothetical protein